MNVPPAFPALIVLHNKLLSILRSIETGMPGLFNIKKLCESVKLIGLSHIRQVLSGWIILISRSIISMIAHELKILSLTYTIAYPAHVSICIIACPGLMEAA